MRKGPSSPCLPTHDSLLSTHLTDTVQDRLFDALRLADPRKWERRAYWAPTRYRRLSARERAACHQEGGIRPATSRPHNSGRRTP